MHTHKYTHTHHKPHDCKAPGKIKYIYKYVEIPTEGTWVKDITCLSLCHISEVTLFLVISGWTTQNKEMSLFTQATLLFKDSKYFPLKVNWAKINTPHINVTGVHLNHLSMKLKFSFYLGLVAFPQVSLLNLWLFHPFTFLCK